MRYIFALLLLTAGAAQANVISLDPNTGIYKVDKYGSVD